jgi:hypothetical protein
VTIGLAIFLWSSPAACGCERSHDAAFQLVINQDHKHTWL